MNKKRLLSFLAGLGLLGLVLSPIASAETATSTAAQLQELIKQLQDQIKTLQLKMEALKQAQTGVQEARQDVQETAKLIKNLGQGMTGEEVKLLQLALAADSDIYPEGLITGYFGSLTFQAVKRFQKKWGIEQVGRVGSKTLSKLNKVLDENPVIMEEDEDGNKSPCAIVPPGHLIAKGWLKKNQVPIVPTCQVLPPGIAKKLGIILTPDVTPPVISAVAVSHIASTTATVAWVTNESTKSKVYYSTTTPLVFSTALNISNNSFVTSHSLDLTGLTASTTYYYAVESKDISNNIATSTEKSFETTLE